MRLLKAKEKKERALNTRLYLKAERCNSPKCAMVRKPYRPGVHGKTRRYSSSEYSRQLKEKQKVQITYGLNGKQMERLFKKTMVSKSLTGEQILALLEKRLDNVAYRLGFAPSRISARQMISHSHLMINGRKMTVPSYSVKMNDKITIRPQSRQASVFQDLEIRFKNFEPPKWLKLDKSGPEGEITGEPKDLDFPFDIDLVVEYYAR